MLNYQKTILVLLIVTSLFVDCYRSKGLSVSLPTLINEEDERAPYPKDCPVECVCQRNFVNCRGQKLRNVPRNFPQNTRIINLAFNEIEAIGASDFVNVPKLLKLNLGNNLIQRIDAKAFQNLRKLTHLRLNSNNLTEIDSNTFKYSPLQLLDLSGNLLKCIEKNSLNTLQESHYQKTISLKDNPISYFPLDALDRDNWTNLEELTMSLDHYPCDCSLLELGKGLLSQINLSGLDSLIKRLTECFLPDQITKKTNYNHDEYFKLYNELINLDRNCNEARPSNYCPQEKLRAARSLVNSCESVCDCTKAPFTVKCQAKGDELVTYVPQDLPQNILELDLSNCNISKLEDDAFVRYTSLKQIDLSRNQIQEMGIRAFKNLTKLSALFLNENQIKRIPGNLYEDLFNLRLLYLHRNRISCISRNSFRNLHQLQILHLSDNELARLPEALFDSLKRLKFLYLMKNPFNCDCRLSWLPEKLKRFESGLDKSRCSSPTHLKGSSIKDLNTGTFECPQNHQQGQLHDEQLLCDDLDNKCPDKCQCQEIFNYSLQEFFLHIICKSAGLTLMPDNLPMRTIYLNLDDNQISKLTSLERLVYLEKLSISGNLITEIGADTFKSNRQLKTLVLGDNKIQNLDENAFKHNKQLEIILLNRNLIKCLAKGTFDETKALRVLTLDSNEIVAIEEGTFANLSLTYLSLDNNRFVCDKRLNWLSKYLRAIGNSVNQVPVCSEPENLTNLYIDSIISMDSEPMTNCSQASANNEACPEHCTCSNKKVDCRNQNLTMIPSDIPRDTVDLNLSGNRITDLNGTLNELSLLTKINLSNNYIEEIDADIFIGLKNLKHLSLERNKLRCIHVKAFHGLTSLETLHLEDNNIHVIKRGTLDNLPSLRKILINNNPLHCDCTMKWLKFFLISLVNDQPKCTSPSKLRNNRLVELNSNDFQCDAESTQLLDKYLSLCKACDVEGYVSPVSCSNKGFCQPTSQINYTCKCMPGHSGRFCERLMTPCEQNPCKNEASCVNLDGNKYQCACKENSYGKNCENRVDLCQGGLKCSNNGTCSTISQTTYKCSCQEGFGGERCETKLAYCTDYNPCGVNGTCYRTEPDGYRCVCKKGFSGENCDVDIDECQLYGRLFCQNGSKCQDNVNGYSCICRPGFFGENCVHQDRSHSDRFSRDDMTNLTFLRSLVKPEDTFDICKMSECKNNAKCVLYHTPEVIGYTCKCPSGYSGKYCEILDEVFLPSALQSHMKIVPPQEALFYPSGMINFTISLDPQSQSPPDSLLMYYYGSKNDPDTVLGRQFLSLEIYQGHLRLLYSNNGIDRYQTFTSINNLTNQQYKSKCDISLQMTKDGEVNLLVDNVSQISSIQHIGVRRYRRTMRGSNVRSRREVLFGQQSIFGKSIIFTNPIYFGGLPTDVSDEARRFQRIFTSLGYVGCISKLSFNQNRINFANLNGLQSPLTSSNSLSDEMKKKLFGVAVGVQIGCRKKPYMKMTEYSPQRPRHYRQLLGSYGGHQPMRAKVHQPYPQLTFSKDSEGNVATTDQECNEADAAMCRNGSKCYYDHMKRSYCKCQSNFTGVFCEEEKGQCKREIRISFLKDPESSCMSQRKIRLVTCSGQCSKTDGNPLHPPMTNRMSCCQPVEYREKKISFHCPETNSYFMKSVKFVRRCSCNICP